MRPGSHSIAALALALVASTLAGSAFAGKAMIPSKELVVGDVDDVMTPLAVILNTGFEAGDGFVLGNLEPQQGWTASGFNAPWVRISGINPASGTQHIRVTRYEIFDGGRTQVFLSPIAVQPASQPNQIRCMLYISNDRGADYDIFGQSPAQGLVAWRVKFHYTDLADTGPGTIFILDDLGTGTVYVDTGVFWNEGVYTELKVQFDPAFNQIRYFYGGVLIYTSAIFAATKVDQFGGVHDNWQLTGEHAGVDGLNMLDTPSDPVPATPASWGGIKGLYRQ